MSTHGQHAIRFVTGTALAIAGLVTLVPHSQADPGPTGAGDYGVHVGYAKAAEAEDGDFLVGGHFELNLLPALGIQAAVDYHGTEEYPTQDAANNVGEAVRVRTIPVTVSGRLYFPVVTGFSPFLTAGGGWYNVIYDYPRLAEELGVEDERVTTFGWHLGAGARLHASERVSVYGEGRYTFVDPNKELGDDVREQIGTLDYDRSHAVVGLSLAF